ncbi:hypothetical protein BJ912DRAFT_949259 [Pholiota molesta]|nr:hypothetical protein BJ912DRAFT_949259 [Pholiota molesta]
MLRENTPKPAMNILEAAISHDVRKICGLVTCELGVLEFQSGERAHVEARVKAAAAKSASQGADVIILGCAGMAGMEDLVQQGPVRVVDGAKAGVQILAGLARLAK